MSLLSSVIGTTAIESTARVKAFIVVSAVLIAFGIVYSYTMVVAGVTIFVSIACVRGYMLLNIVALNRCTISIPSKVATEGDKIPIEVSFENKSCIPIVFVEVSIAYSPYLKLVEGVRGALLVIPPKCVVKLRMVFLARVGTHRVGPVEVAARDVFAFYRFRNIYNVRGFIRVRPRVSETVVRRLLVFVRTSGLTKSRRAGYGVELYSTREYREGDDPRRTIWKYLASKQRLIVKEMELETMNRVLFIVDGTSQMILGPYGYTPFEHCVRIVASIARYLSYRGDLMGIVVVSDGRIHAVSRLEKGKKGYEKIIETVSSYSFESSSTEIGTGGYTDTALTRRIQFNEALRMSLKLLPRERSFIFIFTSYGDKIHRDTLTRIIDKFKLMNNEVFVVIPITTTFEIKGLPEWSYAIYRLKVFERTKNELEFVKQLRKHGVKVVATGVQHIPQMIVSIIESKFIS